MLGDMEVQHLLVEGGPATIAHFLEQDMVDEFLLIKSDVVHKEPVLVDFDLSKLTQGENLVWGKENVHCWKRR
jgi:riboflavin biosynthesis pyrimidine reductase